jgi:hypothetical protein
MRYNPDLEPQQPEAAATGTSVGTEMGDRDDGGVEK